MSAGKPVCLPDAQSFAPGLAFGIGGKPCPYLRRDIELSFNPRNNIVLGSQSFSFVMYLRRRPASATSNIWAVKLKNCSASVFRSAIS